LLILCRHQSPAASTALKLSGDLFTCQKSAAVGFTFEQRRRVA